MADERAALDALIATSERALAALLSERLVSDLVARVRRAGRGQAGGVINPVGRQALSQWLPTAIAALFGGSPAESEALYATKGTVPRVLALATQLAAHRAVEPVVTDVAARLAGQPGALAAVTGQAVNPRPPLFDPARLWVDPNGYRLSDRLWAAGNDVRAAIDTLLDYHIGAGSSAPTIAKELAQYLTPEGLISRTATPYGRSNGIYAPLRLARTETTRAYGAATVQAGAANPFVAGIAWRRSSSHVGQDECDVNATRDDHGLGAGVYPVDKVPSYPLHPQCFPAGTIVTGPPIEASSQRWYTGDVVEIETVRGHILTVTPNHPILTSHGWVAAGSLHEGCHVISSGDAQRVANLVNPDHQYVEALIEQVAVTLGGTLPVTTSCVPTTAEDFHQDGADSQVSVIRTHGHLRDALDSSLLHPTLQGQFASRDIQLARLSSDSVLALGLPGLGLTSTGDMRSRSLGLALFWRHARHFEQLRFGASARRDSGNDELLADSVAGDSVTLGKRKLGFPRSIQLSDFDSRQGWTRKVSRSPTLPSSNRGRCFRVAPESPRSEFVAQSDTTDMESGSRLLARLTGLVSTDRVFHVRRRSFAGHVYNLQTQGSWYIANGIIAHNCKCYLSQVTREDGAAVIAAIARGEVPGGLDTASIVSAVSGF